MNLTKSEMHNPLSEKELDLMNTYWRACNYLSVGMIYLKDNPLLKEPLKTEDVKHRLLGHWGASPALSFVWVHCNRMIVKYDLDMIFVPGQATARRGCWGRRISKERTRRSIRTRAKTPKACRSSLSSSLFPATSAATLLPKRPAPFTKAENWVTAFRMRTAWRWTIAILSSPASSVTERRKQDRSRPRGILTSSSILCATARFCPSSI